MAAPLVQICSRRCLHLSRAYSSRHITQEVTNATHIDDKDETTDSYKTVVSIARIKPHLLRRLKDVPSHSGDPEVHSATQPPPHYFDDIVEAKHKAIIDRQNYAKFGRKDSQIDIASLWPSEEEMKREYAKLEHFKPLAERIADMKAAKKAEQDDLEAHQQKIVKNLAKMDKYIEQYKMKKAKKSEQDSAQVLRNQELLAEAREFFGYDVSKNDIKFQQMVEWKEEEAKREKRRAKKDREKNELAREIASITAEFAAKE